METLTPLGDYADVAATLDPNTLAHCVSADMNMHIWQPGLDGRDIVNLARLQGKTVTALCGFKYVPQNLPQHFRQCDACVGEMANRMAGG